MAIARIVADRYVIQLPEVVSDSTHGDQPAFELITVRLTDSEGNEGVGYTYTGGYGGRAILSLLRDELIPLVVGKNETDIDGVWEAMWWRVHFVGRGGAVSFAIAAIDTALWDLRALKAGLPLWKLLGGTNPQVRIYAGGIDLMYSLEKLLRQTEDNLLRGFRAIKMKVGRPNLDEDIARVRAMRQYLGPDIPLMVDANMAWTVDKTIEAARRLAECDLVWIEEPLVPEDLDGHVRIAAESPAKIATGENFHTFHEFAAMIDAGGVHYPEPDLASCGGITVWRKVAEHARRKGLPVTTHGVHDLHVHLLAAAPNASFLEAHGYGLERYMAHPLTIKDGYAIAPERPGHGVELDWAALDRLRG
jgi:L-alanine-DL-glutamate epimerase-like enolase superfamily enzyme